MRALVISSRWPLVRFVFGRSTVIDLRHIVMISTVPLVIGLTQSSGSAYPLLNPGLSGRPAQTVALPPDAAAADQSAPQDPAQDPAAALNPGLGTDPVSPDAPATPPGTQTTPDPAPDVQPQLEASNDVPLNPGLGSSGQGAGTPQTPPATDQIANPDGGGDPAAPTAPPEPDPGLIPASGTPQIIGGRVSIMVPQNADRIAQIEILTKPEHGNVTVNPDGTLAIVMTGSDFFGPQSFRYGVTYQDGSTAEIDQPMIVTASPQALGWGSGDHYMLRTDDNDAVIIEHGDNHRKVHISGSPTALGIADIAAIEGLSADKITPGWLAQNERYGATPDMALDQQAGGMLWQQITNNWNVGPVSNWLLLERGYSYDDTMGPVLHPSQASESELHPVLIGAYGEGPKPVLDSIIYAGGLTKTQNFVVRDIEVGEGIKMFEAQNVLFENITSKGNGLGIQKSEGVTLRYSDFTDVFKETPNSASPEYWAAHLNRTTATYISETKDILMENNFYDHSGWADDFRRDGHTSGGQPPSMFSHNIYLQYNTSNVTFRDNISMRAASFGAQFRGGAYIEDNVFLDNNAAVNFLGGNYLDFGHFANYSLFADNLVTSGAHKIGPEMVGGLTLGVNDTGRLSTLRDNIVAHLADPANPQEQAQKHVTHYAIGVETEPYFNDTIVYNWGSGGGGGTKESAANANTGHLNPVLLDQTTIQTYAAQLLGRPNATIADLADYLRAHDPNPNAGISDAERIIQYFQDGFGMTYAAGPAPTQMRFIPNPLAEGTRWDNRMNWADDQPPQDGAQVDLAGNWVQYSGTTVLDSLNMGTDGRLALGNGYLEIANALETDGANSAITISRAGQLVLNGFMDTDTLELNVSGGRFANAGHFGGAVKLDASGGQSILALGGGQFDLTDGSQLKISGSKAKVGFDGVGGNAAILQMQSGASLDFVADGVGFSALKEFRSGMFDQEGTHSQSGVNLGGATLTLDVAALGEVGATSHLLIAADEIIGQFGSITMTGLGQYQDALLTLDYGADVLILDLTENGAGSGALNLAIAQDDGRDIGPGLLRDALGNAAPSPTPGLFVGDEEMPTDHIFFM